MKALVSLCGLIVIAVIIYLLVPSVSIQNGGNATLAAINGGDIKGTATLSPFQRGQYTMVDVQVQRLAPGAVYALALRDGSCYGPLVATLQAVTTDSGGQGASSSTITGQISAGWFVVLFNGPTIATGVLACGQVVISSTIGGQGTTPPGTPIISITPSTTPGAQPPPATTPNTPGQFPNTGGGPPK